LAARIFADQCRATQNIGQSRRPMRARAVRSVPQLIILISVAVDG
jgi:hypothetical protein